MMLVLSRNNGERIQIGDNIVITLVHASDGHARIGIEAPREIQVVRDDARKKTPPPGESKPATP